MTSMLAFYTDRAVESMEKQRPAIPRDSALPVAPWLAACPRSPVADKRTEGRRSSCWDSPASSSEFAPVVCSSVCTRVPTRVHPFSCSERFPYGGDDSKYEKQTSIVNIKCATSSSFAPCRYSLWVELLRSEEKQLKYNLRG